MAAGRGDGRGKQQAGAASRRRLSSVFAHIATRSASSCDSHWARARQRDWRVGDRFKLLEDDEELTRLFERVGVRYDIACGRTGEILNLERGSPVAVVQYDLAPDSILERNGHTTIPLAGAMKLVPKAPGTSERAADTLLIQHMEDLARENELPVMVMDATLPGQKIVVTIYRKRNQDVIRRAMDTPSRSFAMLGVHKRGALHDLSHDLGRFPFSPGGLTDICWDTPVEPKCDRARLAMHTGVEVQIEQLRVVNQGQGLQVELKGLRQFELSEGGYTWKEGRQGCRIARVSWCADPVTGDDYGHGEHELGAEHVKNTAAQLPGLVENWVTAVVDGRHERSADHLTSVLDAIGPMPQVDQPGEMAMWVAALINPHPSLGVEKPVAYDVRPSMLKAVTAAHRVSIAVMGIRASIELMAEMAVKSS